ncbi:hypothetical protein FIBSPDRAFT_1047805 [Athelia psychrophila]|uniref:F-box domain-containing protein n=1 Tax=Athelia psychrophila TaxID=1759441 RepID=A0A166ERF9_9AGAM|nr:hypothetical protein FIBSPDRAFT_1047805 [Fibularhizoctonia sp. CBS 109695]
MASLPAELKSLIAANLTVPVLCCPANDLAALYLASVACAAAARPPSPRRHPSLRVHHPSLPPAPPPAVAQWQAGHQHHPGAHRPPPLRNLEWAALSLDATAPLTTTFTALTALGIHRAPFPHAQTLRRLVSSFPALERLALSDITVVPCLCNAYQPSERAAATTVPKGLRSLTLDMGDTTTGKRSQAEELLEWLANGDGCAKLATLDVRGIKRVSFPAQYCCTR